MYKPTQDPAARQLLQQSLQRKLREKQRELAVNVADSLDAVHPLLRQAAQAAIRRNNKSIALITSKLLCSHEQLETQQSIMRGTLVNFYRCSMCKATIATKR